MTQLLLFLIFLAPTIQYRVVLPWFSFAAMEPVVLLASAALILRSRGGGGAVRLMVALALAISVLGVYQRATGGLRPFMSAGARFKLTADWEAVVGPSWAQPGR